MHNSFFLGILLVRKEKKIQNKTTKSVSKQNETKKIKASHFAVETEGRSTEVSPVGQGEGKRGTRLGSHRVTLGNNHESK